MTMGGSTTEDVIMNLPKIDKKGGVPIGKSKKRSWRNPFKRSRSTKAVRIVIDEESYITGTGFSQDPSLSFSYFTPTTNVPDEEVEEEKNSYQFDQDAVLRAESNLQRHVREITEGLGPSASAESSSIPSANPTVKLVSTSGVLLFEGMANDVPDDASLKNIIKEEQMKRKQRNQDDLLTESIPAFVEAPKEYDPIKSGFYRPAKAKNFYDSDSDASSQTSFTSSYSQPRNLYVASTDIVSSEEPIEVTLSNDGSRSIVVSTFSESLYDETLDVANSYLST